VSLADVQHQDGARQHVMRALLSDRLPHAYLFHGPDGVGKETFAYGLSQALLCTNPQDQMVPPEDDVARVPHSSRSEGWGTPARRGTPENGEESPILRVGCGQCPECRLVTARTHPDLHAIYRQLSREHPDSAVRARKALEISVDVVRHFLVSAIGMKPARGRIKIFIVREADRLTQSAQNALLKTLEEPPGSALLILLVTALDRMLPTTLSRCQVVRFDALPLAFVQAKLTELRGDLAEEQREWYARSADGSLGVALTRVEDGWYELNHGIVADLPALASGDGTAVGKKWIAESKTIGTAWKKRDPDITETEASRRGLRTIMHLAALWYADIMRQAEGNEALVINKSMSPALKAATESLSTIRAADAIRRLAQAEQHLERNVNVQLCVENLVNDLTRISTDRKALVRS